MARSDDASEPPRTESSNASTTTPPSASGRSIPTESCAEPPATWPRSAPCRPPCRARWCCCCCWLWNGSCATTHTLKATSNKAASATTRDATAIWYWWMWWMLGWTHSLTRELLSRTNEPTSANAITRGVHSSSSGRPQEPASLVAAGSVRQRQHVRRERWQRERAKEQMRASRCVPADVVSLPLSLRSFVRRDIGVWRRLW